ncbi:alpha/beta hydrolase [Asanoa ferruginea]|uniref:alpha/beta fold hydrolase n=1 Tax=Asanoa ferruginea TaxID=53367 RepID=UPI000E2657A3|nr:alpha/beta fold hydrolase [Asanoa ferruginea]GIF49519.1 alpha/beta hydrolase [Asanoa ferruginea]
MTAPVQAWDGRRLQVDVSGDERGRPVFLLHGTPGSRVGPKPRASVLYRLGVRLICYDRPGYGGSERDPGRTVADAAQDIEAIADQLDIERFAVVGRSGGGPHALAAAALLPERVTGAAVLVGLAPANAHGLDWFQGMTDANVSGYRMASTDRQKLVERLRLRADRARRDPHQLVDDLRSQMTDPDLRVVGDFAIRRLLAQTYSEALRPGPYGWIDDVLALRTQWGFRPEYIRPPVLLWHGADDNFSPASHTRWLAARIPRADVRVQAQTAHFGAMQVLPEMLAWLVDAAAGRARTVPAGSTV